MFILGAIVFLFLLECSHALVLHKPIKRQATRQRALDPEVAELANTVINGAGLFAAGVSQDIHCGNVTAGLLGTSVVGLLGFSIYLARAVLE